tara:strand:+ start:348 stop:5459 length:5112 start_codon:yes stop_codon:yes gene_type:complete
MAKRQTRGLLPQDAQSQSNLLQSIASQNVTPVSPGNQGGFDRVGGASFGSYGGMVGRPQLYGGAADALDAANAVSGLASSLIQYKNTKKKIKANKDNDSLSALEQEWLDEQEKWKAAREKDAARMKDETLALGLEGIDQRDIVASYHGIEPEELSYLLSTNKEEYMRLVDQLPVHFSSSKQRDAWTAMSTKTKNRLRTKEAKLSLSKSSAQMGAQLDKHESSLLRSQFQGIVAELENIPGLSQQEAEDALQSWFDFNLEQNPSLAEDGVWVDIMDNQIDTAAKTINSARARELNGFVDGLAEAGVPDELIDITLNALEGGDLEVLGPLLLAGGLDDDLEETTERIANELRLAELSQDPGATINEDEIRGLALRAALQETRGEAGIESFSPAEITDVIVSLLTTFREDDPEGMFDEDSLVEVGKALGLDPEFFKRENGVFSWGSKFLPSSVLLEEKLKEMVSPVVESRMEGLKEGIDLLRSESRELGLREDILQTNDPSGLPLGDIHPRGLNESPQDYLQRLSAIIEGRSIAINERIEAEVNRYVTDPNVNLDRLRTILGFSENGLWGANENGFLSDATLNTLYRNALEESYASLPKDERDETVELKLQEIKRQHRGKVLEALSKASNQRLQTVIQRTVSNGIIDNPNLSPDELNGSLFGMMFNELVDIHELQTNMQRNLPGLPDRVLDPNVDLRLRFFTPEEAKDLGLEVVNGFAIEKFNTLTGQPISFETPLGDIASAIQTGVAAVRKGVETNARGAGTSNVTGRVLTALNTNGATIPKSSDLMAAVDDIRANQGDAQADAVLAMGVNAGVELPMFKKRGNKPSLAFDAASGDSGVAEEVFKYRWQPDSTGMAAVDGSVLSLETTALTESKDSNERYLGHYLQSIDRAMRTGGEDGVVVEDWATIHSNAQERATRLSRKDTPTDFKNIEAVIFGTATEDEKYNEERDLLNIIAGVIGDKDIGGFGIEEDRSLLGVTLYDVDLDEDWGRVSAAFNFEDEGTRNFWRHMIRDLVVDLGTNEAGIPVDISQFAEAGTFQRSEFEKKVGEWFETNVRTVGPKGMPSRGSGKYVLIQEDSTNKRQTESPEGQYRVIYDPQEHLQPDLRLQNDITKVQFGSVTYSPDGLIPNDDTIRVGTEGITNLVSLNPDQMEVFAEGFLDEFYDRHGDVLKIPEEYLELLSNEEGWQDEWVTNPTVLEFVELLKADPEPQDIITFVNQNQEAFVDIPFSITDTGTIENAYFSPQLDPSKWRTTQTWGDGVELFSSLTNGVMPDVGYYRLLGAQGTTQLDLIAYAAARGNLGELIGQDPNFNFTAQSLRFVPMPISDRGAAALLTLPPGYNPKNSDTWIDEQGNPMWRDYTQFHEGYPMRLQFVNASGEVLEIGQQNPTMTRVGYNRETGEFEHEQTSFPLLRSNKYRGLGHLVPPTEVPRTFFRNILNTDADFFRDPNQQRSLKIEDHLGKPLMFRDPYTGQTELVKVPEKVEEGEDYLVGTSTNKDGDKLLVSLRKVGNTLVVVRGFRDQAGRVSEAAYGSDVMYPFTAHSSNGFRALQELRGMIDDTDARAIEIQLERGLDRGQRVRVGGRGSGGVIDIVDPTLQTTPVDQDGNPIDPPPTTFDRTTTVDEVLQSRRNPYIFGRSDQERRPMPRTGGSVITSDIRLDDPEYREMIKKMYKGGGFPRRPYMHSIAAAYDDVIAYEKILKEQAND